jgi:hypothetical protein
MSQKEQRLKKGREHWKAQNKMRYEETKALKMRLKETTENRDKWKAKAEENEKLLLKKEKDQKELEIAVATLQTELEGYKKKRQRN